MRNLLVIATALVASSALAQEGKGRPWHVDLGVYFPTFSVNGISKEVGATLGLGYSFLRPSMERPYEAGLELRGTGFRLKGGGDKVDFSVSQISAFGRYHLKDSPVFLGLGLGYGRGSASSGNFTVTDNSSHFAYFVEAGSFVNPGRTLYAAARYTGSSEDYLRGFGVSIGYRF
ncbi:hypothetical protein EON79_07095 [bacterium]|nr:MAG: hypothetical protein EON79_07095 [bacterium]